MRKSILKIIAGLLFLPIISLSAEAGGLFKTDISAGCGIISGDTKYLVGGKTTSTKGSYKFYFPVSKLVFPIDAAILTLTADLTVKDKLTFSISWGRELNGDPDKLRDYDWQTSPDVLSIYSESRLDMEADIFLGKLQYRILQFDIGRQYPFFIPGDKWKLLAGAGCHYRHLDFKAYDTLQTYPNKDDDNDFVSGPTLDYSVKYLIPFLELGLMFEATDKATAALTVGYSPFVQASDEDRHLLRDLSADGEDEGEALLLSLDCRYDFLKHWYALLSLSHIIISTEGTSKTYLNGDWDHTIAAEIKSTQSTALLAVGFTF